MNINHNTQILSQRYNVNETFFNIVTNRHILKTVIKDIRADRHIHIEVLQFVYNTDFYPDLERQLKTKREELSKIDSHQIRRTINDKILKIEDEMKQYKIDILNTAYSLLELKETENINSAKKHFFKGSLRTANDIFETERLETTKNKLTKQLLIQEKLEDIYNKLVDNAFEFQVKAQLTSLNLDITEPEDRFQKSVEYFEKGLLSIERSKQIEQEAKYKFEYASFLHDKKQISKALNFFEQTLTLRRLLTQLNPDLYLPSLSLTLNNIGSVYKNRGEYQQAESVYQEALGLNRELALNDERQLSNAGAVLNNLGNLYHHWNNYPKAEKSFEEALTIARVFAQKDVLYLEDVASRLTNLAILQVDKNDTPKAKMSYEEALEIYKTLALKDERKFLPKVALVLNNMGIMYRKNNEHDEAEKYYKEALDKRQQLARIDPHRYLPYVANTHNNLGLCQREMRDFLAAKENYEEAIKTYKRLLPANPKTYKPYLGGVLNNLGTVLCDIQTFSEAENILNAALDIYKELEIANPKTYTSFVAILTNNIAQLQRELKQLSKSERTYETALSIYRKLAKENKDTYLSYVARTLTNFGGLLEDSSKLNKAEEVYSEALYLSTELANDNPKVYLPHLAMLQINLAKFYQNHKPNKPYSVHLLGEAIINLRPFRHLPQFQRYLKIVFDTLTNWNIDSEKFYVEKMQEYTRYINQK